MQSLLTILQEVHDPRDFNARHEVGTILFLSLAATLCGAKTCVEMADFADGLQEHLSEIVDLPHGPPSHDTFSRLFRLLDPAELAKAFSAFMTALRPGLACRRRAASWRSTQKACGAATTRVGRTFRRCW